MTIEKRRPGRPPKNPRPNPEVREAAGAREEVVRTAPRGERKRTRKGGVGSDRLHIPRELIPEGVDLQWVTNSVIGSPAPQQRMAFEVNGWRPVTPDMFDGRFDGMFMPKGYKGEIEIEGLVLMERPMELTLEARTEERQNAMGAVRTQESRLKKGDLEGVTLDTQHPSARANTYLTKTVESGIIPNE